MWQSIRWWCNKDPINCDEIVLLNHGRLEAFLISLLRGIFTAFFGRFCMFVFLFLASGAISSLNDYSQRTVYLYGLLFLSMLGTLLQYYFQADQAGRDAVFSLGMDAKQYIRALFTLKTVIAVAGYILFGIPSALFAGVPWYLALLIPVSGAGFIAGSFVVYLDLYPFTVILLLLSAVLFIPGLVLIRSFPYGLYRTAMNAEYRSMQITKEKEKRKKNPELEISPTEGIRSGAGGYRFLNELFLKRHRKILWGRMFLMILFTAAGLALTSLFLRGELKEAENVKDSVLLMQVFISVRYLIIYYLIQPFTGNIMGRSRLTEFLNFVLCIVCFILPFTRLSALQLTLVCMVLTGLYILLGDLLVSRFGPKTFRAK